VPIHTRTQADGTWVTGYEPPAADWEDLDRKIFHSWNGERGGAYCPTDLITINGAGLQVTTKVRLVAGGAIYGSAAVFKIRDGTWPTLGAGHVGRTRRILQPIHTWMSPKPYLWARSRSPHGVGSIALAARMTFAQAIEVPELYIPLRVVDGSLMTKVEVRFRVASPRLLSPIAMPRFRVLRVPRDPVANPPEPLRATDDGLGFFSSPLVTTPHEWYRDGAAQGFEYICDQNHTIDVANFSYIAHLIEEQGTLTPDEAFDGIRFIERKPDIFWVTPNASQDLNGLDSVATEGFPAGVGMRMLVVDSDAMIESGRTDNESVRNGIWLQQTGAWTRSDDLDEPDDFSPNWIVRSIFGKTNGSSVWQCQYPARTSRINLTTGTSDTKTQISITQPRVRGNLYHSLTPTFELTDLRFQ
jgi:hypothetical protein